MEPELRRCRRCDRDLPVSEFATRHKCATCERARLRAKNSKWQRKNPEKINAIHRRNWNDAKREWKRNWLKNNPEKRRAIIARWRAKPENMEKVRAQGRDWAKKNRDKMAAKANARRARLAGHPPNQMKALIAALFAKATTCPDCNRRYTKMRTKSLDHIIALAHGGKHSIENLRIICGQCNSSKGPRQFVSNGQGLLL